MKKLTADVKNYLDITYQDDGTDKKVDGILKSGIQYLDQTAGEAQDYEKDGLARQLLFDYCRYVINNAFEFFQENYKSELITLRIGVQADEYAEKQGYI